MTRWNRLLVSVLVVSGFASSSSSGIPRASIDGRMPSVNFTDLGSNACPAAPGQQCRVVDSEQCDALNAPEPTDHIAICIWNSDGAGVFAWRQIGGAAQGGGFTPDDDPGVDHADFDAEVSASPDVAANTAARHSVFTPATDPASDHSGFATAAAIALLPHTTAANAHHAEDHASRHADGGADELAVEGLATGCGLREVAVGDGAGGLACAELVLEESGLGGGVDDCAPVSPDFPGQWCIDGDGNADDGSPLDGTQESYLSKDGSTWSRVVLEAHVDSTHAATTNRSADDHLQYAPGWTLVEARWTDTSVETGSCVRWRLPVLPDSIACADAYVSGATFNVDQPYELKGMAIAFGTLDPGTAGAGWGCEVRLRWNDADTDSWAFVGPARTLGDTGSDVTAGRQVLWIPTSQQIDIGDYLHVTVTEVSSGSCAASSGISVDADVRLYGNPTEAAWR